MLRDEAIKNGAQSFNKYFCDYTFICSLVHKYPLKFDGIHFFSFSTFSSIFKKICWHTVIIFLWQNLFIILKPWNIINPLMHQSFDYTLWQRSTKYATSSLVSTLWKNLSANFCHVIMVMNCFCRQPWLQKGSSSGSFTIVNFQHNKIRIDPGSPKQKSLVLPHFLEYCIETWKKLYPFLHSWGLGLGTNGLLQVNVKDVFMFNGNLCLSWVTKTSLRFSVLLTFLVP